MIKPTGIKRNTSLLHNQDGACTELINFRFKDEEWQSIQPGTLYADLSSLVTAGDIIYKHNVLPINEIIWWDSSTGNVSILNTTTLSYTLITTIAAVTKIYEFGVILIILTSSGATYIKYDTDVSIYVVLQKIQHGRYTFSDGDREKFGNEFALTAGDNWVNTGITRVLERKKNLEKEGKTNGHVFFRMAFKTNDGNYVEYSPIYYRNIGFATGIDGTINPDLVPNIRDASSIYSFSWGEWAAPYFNFTFTTEQLNIINAYKGIIESLCIFMTPPHMDWDETAGEGAMLAYINGTTSYYFYPPSTDVPDFFANNDSFYLVQEVKLTDIETYFLSGLSGGTFTANVGVATALPSPPGTIDKVIITLVNTLGDFTYVENTDYTIDYTNKEITTLASRSTVSEAIYIASSVVKYSLGAVNLFAFRAHDSGGIGYPDNYFTVDYVNGTAQLTTAGLSLLHTTVYFDFDYGIENGSTLTASYGTPLTGKLNVGDLSVIQTNISLPVDNYTSHRYFSDVYREYNSRMHWGGVKTKLSEVLNFTVYDTNDQGHLPTGYTKIQDATDQTWTFIAVATLETDNGTKTVVTEITDIAEFLNTTKFSCLNQVIIYPDSRATSLTVLGYQGVLVISAEAFTSVFDTAVPLANQSIVLGTVVVKSSDGLTTYTEGTDYTVNYISGTITVLSTGTMLNATTYQIDYNYTSYKSVMQTIPLTAHNYGNFSFNIASSTLTSVSYGTGTPALVSKRILLYNMLSLALGTTMAAPVVNDIVLDKNRVQVSELNNPLLFPAKNSYRTGALSSTVVGISSQAVAVSIGQFGQYPVYVFTNEGIWALQQGSTVLYQSIQPVSLLEANNANSIIPIDGGILFATAKGLFILAGSEIKEISIPVRGTPETFINSLPSFTTTQTNLPANISTIDFVKWMEGAIFGYDKVNKEIIISKDDTYIFSLESGMWYKEASVYSDFLRIGGKFYGMIGNTLYDRETPDDTSDVTAYVITRPVKFASDGLKSISKTVLRLIADMNTKETNMLSYHVYGSLNGFEWRLIQGKDYTDFINSSGIPGKEISLEFTRTTARYFIFLLALKSKVIRLEGFDVNVEPKYNDKER